FAGEVLAAAKAKLTPQLAEVLDLETPVPTLTKSLNAVELSALYRDKGVPPHRFAYKELAAFVSSPSTLSAEGFKAIYPGIVIDPGIIGALFPVNGDTTYEELACIGLDPNAPDQLVGIIRLKGASGYSGGPCTHGSAEYVTFWGDFDGNGPYETCLGTASVTVYDVSAIPADGAYFAVRLPV